MLFLQYSSRNYTIKIIEFIERDAILWTIKYSDIKLEIDDSTQAFSLLIEVDGDNLEKLYEDCGLIENVLKKFECGDILLANSSSEKENLWKLRRSISDVKSNSIYKEEDTVVPRAELAKLLKGTKEIGKKFGFKSVCYGHAGDGNLHINIIKDEMSDFNWNNILHKGIREIFELTKSLGGTISGEHGIGYVQKEYIDVVFSKKEIELQKGIKKLFDPKNILNPEKIFK